MGALRLRHACAQETGGKAASGPSLPTAVKTGAPAEPEPAPAPAPAPTPTPAPGPKNDADQMGADGTPCGPGASAAAAEKAVLSLKGAADPSGSKVAPLLLRSNSQTKGSIKLSWSKPAGAARFVVYGAAGAKGSKMAKLATTSGKSLNVKKVAGKKLKKGTYYRFVVVSLDARGNVASTSKVIHVATKGAKKASNPTKVTVSKKVLQKAKKLKAGKTLKLKAKTSVKKGTKAKKYVKVRYESSNPSIAKVNSKGTVRGVKKGKCYVYAYAQNGAVKKVKVVVK